MNQPLQGSVDSLLAGLADPFAANGALVIDDVKRWCGGEIPLTVDGALVVERPPVDPLFRHHPFQFTWFMRPGIDADHCERLFFQIRYERPLVRPGGPSRQSELAPEIKQHDLAAIVTQFELLTVLVFAFDVGRSFADAQVTNVVQF